jgi:hypothetical protein
MGACVPRAGTWRNVEVFRVRIEVGVKLELDDATSLASGTTAGEEVVAKGIMGELKSWEEEEIALSGGGTSSAGPEEDAGVSSGVEGDEFEVRGVVVTCNPLGTMLLMVSGGCC